MPDPPKVTVSTEPAADYLLSTNALIKYNQQTDNNKKQELRNEIIDARMAELDAKFREFERSLYKEGIGSGVGTDWTLLTLTAAATISTVTTTKTTLAALATAIAGGSAVFKKEALFDKTMPALMAQMHAERELVRAEIRKKEQLSTRDYTWYAAESDLMRFEYAASIPAAINAVATDAGVKATAAKAAMNELNTGTYSNTDTGKILARFWKPDGKSINTKNEASLEKWMEDNHFSTTPGSITVFLRTAEQEEARKRAVQELGLAVK
jgi:hypothetical protein